MALRLSFHGGAGTVTGSRHLLDTGRSRVQIDAGMFQGLRELRELNWRTPPYPAKSIDAVFLTHAHIDHSGVLPRFVKNGFDGPIYCTPPTHALLEILLYDSARIQEQDAAYANKKGYSKHKPALPLYDADDVEKTLAKVETLAWNSWHELPDLRVRFRNAGHILGAGFVEVHSQTDGRERHFVFSGDVGRYDVPLHVDPLPPAACDALIVESTYGDRTHPEETMEEQIRGPFAKTLGRGGVVVIPSFAVGRAQQITLMLRELMNEGRVPEVPIHIDSPMAVNTTEVYSRFLNEHNLDGSLLDDGRSRLFPRNVHLHRSVEESKELNDAPGPRIILSSSGMLSGGRILHHLKRRLPERKNLVVLAGYQAAGTRGRALLEGRRSLRIHGRDIPVVSDCMSISGLSAHADRNELLRWIGSGEAPPRSVYTVHGEPEAAESLAWKIRGTYRCPVRVPRLDESFDVEEVLNSADI